MTTSLINPSLDQIRLALDLLEHPECAFNSIHIAGTNGKGSTVLFLDLLFRSFTDLKVGRYTSPHISSITERIVVDGLEIGLEEYQKLEQELGQGLGEDFSSLTEFERITTIAFEYFKDQAVDLVILETGLGGRWDATNVVPAHKCLATAITNIALDHMDYLGNTLEQIRFEKEGIIKTGVKHFEGQRSDHEVNSIQGSNFLLALEIFEHTQGRKLSSKEQESVLAQFEAQNLSRFCYKPARNLIIDSAHNAAAAARLKTFVASKSQGQEVYLISLLDKDYQAFFEELFDSPANKQVLLTAINSERATSPQTLQASLLKQGFKQEQITCFDKSKQAYEELKKYSDLKIICGSIYLLGELLA